MATIGGNYYVYDPMGRVVTASVQRPDQAGSQVITYGYDVYGNRTTVNSAAASAASLATNRLTSGGAIHDAAGNLVQWQPPGSALVRQYTYDSLDMITNEVTGGQAVANIYTADDERLWRYEVTRNVSHWTVRDAGGRVLREFVDDPADDNGAAWKLSREYIYRDGKLLAVNTSTGTEHYSLDHLGSPRLVTDGSRNKRFEHHYLPFGGEWTIGNDPVDGSKLRFTSHERDTDLADQPAGSLDYMHARYYSSSMGRFLSVDPVVNVKRAMHEPRGWNRYAYAVNNPIRYIDPDGREHVQEPGLTRSLAEADWSDAPPVIQGAFYAGGGLTAAGAFGLGFAGPASEGLAAGAFDLAPIARGNFIENALARAFGGGLPRTFPVIDRFLAGVATSVKSVDLLSRTYQSAARLASTLTGYVDRLAQFGGARLGNVNVPGASITQRVLEVVVQKGVATPEQLAAIQRVAAYAKENGIVLKVIQIR